MSAAREEILNRLSKSVHAVAEPPDFEHPVFPPVALPLAQAFQTQLESINGKVFLFQTEAELFESLKIQLEPFQPGNVFCSENEFIMQLHKFGIGFSDFAGEITNMEAGITGCEFLVAQTGSVMVSAAQGGGRQMLVFPPLHIVIAKKNQLVDTLEAAYSAILDKYPEGLPSQIALITGPSRTADIEKTLVLGAHGPRELRVFLLV